jgi:colanic acid biosynthesis glycosyl transferase WcaI
VAAGSRPERTTYVHNWADVEAITPVLPERNPFIERHGLQGKCVVLYSGNAGRAHDFEALHAAMRQLRDDPQIRFHFIGGGVRFPEVQEEACREGLSNAHFQGYLPREELRYSLAAATVAVVTEAPAAAGLLVPSKTYGILAGGKPVLFIGSEESDVATLVREHECGMVVPPDDPDALVAAIRHLRDHPEVAEQMGARGRRAAEAFYSRKVATREWLALLSGTCFPADRSAQQRVVTKPGPVDV